MNEQTVPNGWPMSMPDLQRLNDFVSKHQKILRCHSYGAVVDRLFDVVKHYESTALDSMEQAKRWRDEMVVYLRALSMILEMVGNANTHGEKAARLRGCVEMIETGIAKMNEMTFEISRNWFRSTDLFRSDFPVRQYMDRIRELEYKLKKATGKEETRTILQADPDVAPF